MNQFMTYSAFLLGLTQLIFAFNFFYSLVFGPKAAANPWHSNTLEWAAPSPPPHYNFETIPTVYHAAYEYSVPGVDDRLPAPDRAAAGRGRAARPGHGLTWAGVVRAADPPGRCDETRPVSEVEDKARCRLDHRLNTELDDRNDLMIPATRPPGSRPLPARPALGRPLRGRRSPGR